jgi:hypothetical protein
MRNNKFWTQDTVQKFIAFISQNGGEVRKVYELREGYQFDVRPPVTAEKGWALEMMNKFEGVRA